MAAPYADDLISRRERIHLVTLPKSPETETAAIPPSQTLAPDRQLSQPPPSCSERIPPALVGKLRTVPPVFFRPSPLQSRQNLCCLLRSQLRSQNVRHRLLSREKRFQHCSPQKSYQL